MDKENANPNGGESSSVTVVNNASGKKVSIAVKNGTVSCSELSKIGLRSYDPGYTNTVCCTSRISFIDGNAGILRSDYPDVSFF